MESSQVSRRIGLGLVLVMAAVLLIMVGAIAYWQQITGVDGQAGVGPEKGQIAPDFSVRSPDGETVRLSNFQGKIILLNFFATWCGPCKKEAPHLKAAYERKSDDVAFLGVTFQDTAGSVRAFTAEFEIPFPLTLDVSGEVGQAYRVRGLPTTFFIRADGVVHYVVKGPMTKEFVELILDGMQE